MALYIITKNEIEDVEQVWYVGDDNPRHKISVDQVIKLEADGDELDYIEKRFPSLTPKKSWYALWYGDIARTIFLNL